MSKTKYGKRVEKLICRQWLCIFQRCALDRTKDVDGKLEELQKQLLQKANRNEQYDDLVEEIYKLREEKQQILADKAEMEGVKQSIFNMKAFLNSQTTEIEEYDEQLVRRLIAKVTVYDEKFEVELKSGLSVDIKRSK